MGSKVEIPFWLAERLVKRGIVTIDLPRFYGPEYRGKLKAGPTAVALGDWSPSYYHLGVKLSKLSDVENIDFEVREEMINLLPLLRQVCKSGVWGWLPFLRQVCNRVFGDV